MLKALMCVFVVLQEKGQLKKKPSPVEFCLSEAFGRRGCALWEEGWKRGRRRQTL